jgi:MarR family 2-MHQ and catechol resistance regulon transcriptional repressor
LFSRFLDCIGAFRRPASFCYLDVKALCEVSENPMEQIEEPDGARLWLVLWKAYNAVRDYALADIASLGLKPSDFAILEVLLHKGPTTVNDLGSKVLLTSGSMTTAVDRLARRKLVERRSHPDDRRARLVDLTPEGRNLIESAFAAHATSLNVLGEALTPRERAQAVRLLKKLGLAAGVLAAVKPALRS